MTGPVEISRESWEYRLVAAVVSVVDQRVGGTAAAPRTRWNGRVLVDTDPDFLGAADDDGNLWVSDGNILEPLRKARDLDRSLTGGEVLEIRDAIATLTHEAVHLLAESGDGSAPDAHPFDAAAEADNEGRTEHWTLVNLDGVIHDVFPHAGLEAVAAEVLAETSRHAGSDARSTSVRGPEAVDRPDKRCAVGAGGGRSRRVARGRREVRRGHRGGPDGDRRAGHGAQQDRAEIPS